MEFRSLPNLFIELWLQKVRKLCAKFLSQAKSRFLQQGIAFPGMQPIPVCQARTGVLQDLNLGS